MESKSDMEELQLHQGEGMGPQLKLVVAAIELLHQKKKSCSRYYSLFVIGILLIDILCLLVVGSI